MSTVHVATRAGLVVCHLEDETAGWELDVRLSDRRLECVALHQSLPERVFVGTFESGLFRSVDGGETFERVTSAAEGDGAFESDRVTALATSPHDPDVVYAGLEPSRVYRSSDGGESWRHLDGIADLPSADEWFFPPRPDTHHVRWIEVDPFDPDRLYVGIELGALVLSDDGGETWRERPPGSRRDNHSLAVHTNRMGRVYSAAGDGYAESDDGGESWHQPQDGLEHRYCWSVVPDPDDPDRVMVSSASGASTAHQVDGAESYVYRRPGPDERWERLDGRGLPTGEGVVRAVLAAGETSKTVYAVNNRGLFNTTDFGDTWEAAPVDWPEAASQSAPRGIAIAE